MKKKSYQPMLEGLEHRLVPAFTGTVNFDGSNLYMSGTTDQNNVDVTWNGSTITITDGAATFNYEFAVTGNVTINLRSTANAAFDVDLLFSTSAFPGNFTGTFLGLGLNQVDSTVTGSGGVQGALSLTTGGGNDTFTFSDTTPTGNLSINAGSSPLAGGDSVTLSGAMTIGGNLTVRNVNNLQVTGALSVQGITSVTTDVRTAANVVNFATGASTFGGAFSLTGASNADSIGFNIAAIFQSGFTANLMAGNDTFQVTTVAPQFLGNLTVLGGVGSDSIVVGTTGAPIIGGSLTIDGGLGNDTVTLGTSGATVIGGRSVSINTGDGNDIVSIGAATAPLANLSVNLGNGNDSLGFPTATTVLFARGTANGGAGVDTLTIGGGALAFPFRWTAFP